MLFLSTVSELAQESYQQYEKLTGITFPNNQIFLLINNTNMLSKIIRIQNFIVLKSKSLLVRLLIIWASIVLFFIATLLIFNKGSIYLLD